jgi:hypothetical protein
MYKALLMIAVAVLAYVVFENGYACYKNIGLETLVDGSKPAAPYQPYQQLQSDPKFLGVQNAANIAFLKEQLDGLVKVKNTMDKLQQDVNKNSTALKEIGNELESKSAEMVGRTPGSTAPIPGPAPGSLSVAPTGPV